MLFQIIGYTIIVMFIVTFSVTIWGLLEEGRIEKKYMAVLVTGVVLEVASAFFFLFREGFGGGVDTDPPHEAVYVFDQKGDPTRFDILDADSIVITIDSAGVSFRSIERDMDVSENRDTLFFTSKRMGTVLGYVRVQDVRRMLNLSESLLPDQKPEDESYSLGLFHGRFDDNRPPKNESLATLYLLQALKRGNEAAYQDNRAFYDRVRQRLVRSLLHNQELTAKDYDVIIAATENLGGNLTKGHDLGEIYLAYAQELDEDKYQNALESFEEFLGKESIVRSEVDNAEEMINNAKIRVDQIRPLFPDG